MSKADGASRVDWISSGYKFAYEGKGRIGGRPSHEDFPPANLPLERSENFIYPFHSSEPEAKPTVGEGTLSIFMEERRPQHEFLAFPQKLSVSFFVFFFFLLPKPAQKAKKEPPNFAQTRTRLNSTGGRKKGSSSNPLMR